MSNIKVSQADGYLQVDATAASPQEIIDFIEFMEERELTDEEKEFFRSSEEE